MHDLRVSIEKMQHKQPIRFVWYVVTILLMFALVKGCLLALGFGDFYLNGKNGPGRPIEAHDSFLEKFLDQQLIQNN